MSARRRQRRVTRDLLRMYFFFLFSFLLFFFSFSVRELSLVSLSLFPLLSIDLWLGFSEISENTRKIFSSSSFSLSHRQKYTSHSKHIITNKLFIKMATSSTFIAQPNFLVKKNVFTVSQSRRASFFFVCARFRSSSKSRSHFARDTKVMMTCKKSWTKTNSNKYEFYICARRHEQTHSRTLFLLLFSRVFLISNRLLNLERRFEPPVVEDRSSKLKRFSTLARRKKLPGNRWCASIADTFTEVISARCQTRTDARLAVLVRIDSKPR